MSRYYFISLFVALFLLAPCFPYAVEQAADGTIAIVNGKIITMAGEPIERGTVIIENGRITAVGKNIQIPAHARRIDATGKIVLPGMIDSSTHIGLQEISQVEVTQDLNEVAEPIMPQLRVVDGIYPDSAHIAVTRINGITSVLSMPGSADVISGQSAFLRLDGATLSDMLIKAPVAMHLNLGEEPKRTYGGKNKSPQTRMGISSLVRDTFIKARNYEAKWQDYERKLREFQDKEKEPQKSGEKKDQTQPSQPDRDLKSEAILQVLQGKMPVIVTAQRLDDIGTAMRLADEFGFKLILANATEAYKIAPQLAARNIPVLYGPINQQPATMETAGAIYEAAAILQRAGVKIAIHSGNDGGFSEAQSRNLPFMAGVAVAYGLPYNEALKAITINPAQILGVDTEVGSLEIGKSADLVVCDGDPLEPRSKILHVFIAGRKIPLRSYQTDLYDHYK